MTMINKCVSLIVISFYPFFDTCSLLLCTLTFLLNSSASVAIRVSLQVPGLMFPHCSMIPSFCASPVVALLSLFPLWFFCSALISFSCSLLISLPICISSQHAPLLLCKFAMSPMAPPFPVPLFSLSLPLVWTIVFVYLSFVVVVLFFFLLVMILPLPFLILFACSSWFPYFDPCLPRNSTSFGFNEVHWMLRVLLFVAASVHKGSNCFLHTAEKCGIVPKSDILHVHSRCVYDVNKENKHRWVYQHFNWLWTRINK